MMGKRRRGRETALKLLYALDITQESVDELLQASWLDTVVPEAVREFSVALVAGVMAHQDEIDTLVQEWSMNWSLERIGIIERNILRFAIYELLFLTDIPPNVTINEAVEVAKRYGTDEAPSFINGILDRIKQEIEARAGETPATLTRLSHLPSA
jgi:transcription antitermination protein NusB